MENASTELAGVNAQHVAGISDIATTRGAIADQYHGSLLGVAGSAGDDGVEIGHAADGRFAATPEHYDSLGLDGARREAAQQLRSSYADFSALQDVILLRQSPPSGFSMPSAEQVPVQFAAAEDGFNSAVETLRKAEVAAAQARQQAAESAVHEARTAVQLILLVGLGAASAVAFLVLRLIRRQLSAVAVALDAVAGGDLTVETPVLARDELGGHGQRYEPCPRGDHVAGA